MQNDAADVEFGIYAGAGDAFQIWTGTSGAASSRLWIETDGRVGIAGAPETGINLHIDDPVTTTKMRLGGTPNVGPHHIEGHDQFHQILFRGYPTGEAGGYNFANIMSFTEYGGDFHWYKKNGSILKGLMALSGEMLGIGTMNPYEKLHVEGDMVLGARSTHATNDSYSVLQAREYTLNEGLVDGINSRAGNTLNIRAGIGTGAGINGDINFYTEASTVVQGNSIPHGPGSAKLTILSTGNVGIGTTTPKVPFEVKVGNDVLASIGGTISAGKYSGLHFGYFEPANTLYRKTALVFERTDYGVGSTARGKIHFLMDKTDTNASVDSLTDSVFTIDESGNVGINTATPEHKLTVIADDDAEIDAIAAFYTNNKSVGVEIHNQGIGITNETADGSTPLDANTNFRIDARGTGSVIINTHDGTNVGIGTFDPSHQLHVKTAGESAAIAIQTDGFPTWVPSFLYYRGDTLEFGTRVDDIQDGTRTWSVYDHVAGAYRLSIDAAGGVHFGGAFEMGGQGLTINEGGHPGAYPADSLIMDFDIANGRHSRFFSTGDASTLGGFRWYSAKDGGAGLTLRMEIDSAGQLTVPGIPGSGASIPGLGYSNGILYYYSSSIKYKKNIVDIEVDTSKIYNLRPVSFDDKASGERNFGLIAEEVYKEVPELVVLKEEEPDSIVYANLSVLLLAEVKKLRARVEQLEEKMAQQI